jgi:hypothetical protein
MKKIKFPAQPMFWPHPTVLAGANVDNKPNFTAVAWTGIAASNPASINIALQPNRWSLKGINQNRTFSVNIPSVDLVINESIKVSDTPLVIAPVSLVINESIKVSDVPELTPVAPTTYTLTIKVNGAGNTLPPAGTYTFNKGISVPIAAVPAPGWYFLVWTGGVANPNAAGTSVSMDGDKTVTANFGAPGIQATIHSPGELRVYNSQNRVTGLVNGVVKEEIANSSYNGTSNTVTINPATDSYYYQVNGTGTGSYGLDLVYSLGGQTTTFNATGIPILSGAINRYSVNWTTLSQGQPGVTVQLDLNGDGVFEISFNSDGTLTLDEYMSQLDTAPPVTTVLLNPAPNSNGWNNTNVTAKLRLSIAAPASRKSIIPSMEALKLLSRVHPLCSWYLWKAATILLTSPKTMLGI